jgi:hypothetical protein
MAFHECGPMRADTAPPLYRAISAVAPDSRLRAESVASADTLLTPCDRLVVSLASSRTYLACRTRSLFRGSSSAMQARHDAPSSSDASASAVLAPTLARPGKQ